MKFLKDEKRFKELKVTLDYIYEKLITEKDDPLMSVILKEKRKDTLLKMTSSVDKEFRKSFLAEHGKEFLEDPKFLKIL